MIFHRDRIGSERNVNKIHGLLRFIVCFMLLIIYTYNERYSKNIFKNIIYFNIFVPEAILNRIPRLKNDCSYHNVTIIFANHIPIQELLITITT